jgi:uncharacterized protein involved in propanediol utilization
MLSTIRALQEIFGFLLREKTISEIFLQIEPHDGLMYKSCVVYDHRKGELLKELIYIPEYWVVAVDFGGEINTIEYNKNLLFTEEITHQYDSLLRDIEKYFHEKNDVKIAECATESTKIHLSLRKNPIRQEFFDSASKYNPIGIVNTHSGTCLGLLYPKTVTMDEITQIAERITSECGYPVFTTTTLKLLI